MDRLQLGQAFHFANNTLGESLTDLVTKYNEKHGTEWSRGWVSRLIADYKAHTAQHKLIAFPGSDYQLELPRYDHPLHIYSDNPTDANFVIFDTHSPFLNIPFTHALIQHMRWHKQRGNRVNLFHGGDLQDNSALSRHPKTKAQMLMERQFDTTRAMLTSLFQVLDHAYFVRGNHDDWFSRLVDGTLGMGDYWSLIFSGLDDSKVHYIDDTKMILHNCGSLWRITHSINFSIIAGRNANKLANKFDSNVITGHEHSLAVMRDDNNRHTVLACGMMADYALMNYVHDYDTKHNIMKNAYVVIQDGKFEIMTPYPEWQDWQQYGVDPLPMYEYENQKQQVLTGKLDMLRWLDTELEQAA